MKKIGLIVTIVYVALEYGGRYVTGHSASLDAIGVGAAPQDLIAGALNEAAAAIGVVALTVGIAIPSIKGEPVVKKDGDA